MKKTAEIVTYSLVCLLILIAVFTYLAPHFGWRVDAVTSGSMEPALSEGSIVVVKPVEPDTIQAGDIISFRTPDIDALQVTHRVVDVTHDQPPVFSTKGDANHCDDPFVVPTRNVDGRVILTVPFIGAFIGFLKTMPGFVIGIVLPGVFIIVAYGVSVWRAVRNTRRRSADDVVSIDNEAGRY